MIVDIIKENRKNILLAFLNVLFLFAVVYVTFLYLRPADHIATERAGLETRREIMSFTAYIFRNEQIIYADAGSLGIRADYMLENGEKAARNQIVARISQSTRANPADFTRSELIRAEIEALENQIDILRRSSINLEHTPASIQSVSRDSDDLYIETLRSVRNNRIGDALRNRDTILVLLNKGQIITGEVYNFTGVINSLSARKAELEFQLSSLGAPDTARNIYAARSGIFYRRADGFENYFTGSAVRTLNPSSFGELINRRADADILNRAIGKIAYDYRWYIVTQISRREFESIRLTEGQRYNVIFPYSSNRVIPFIFRSRISEPGSDEILLVFETTIIPVDFYFLRRQTVQIVLREVTGIRVPDSAIAVREVSRRFEADRYGVISEVVEIIEPGDSGLIDGERILGETIKGVYILHGREVRFRALDPADRLAEFDGYALYAARTQRSAESTTTLQADENIIVSGRNRYIGRITS